MLDKDDLTGEDALEVVDPSVLLDTLLSVIYVYEYNKTHWDLWDTALDFVSAVLVGVFRDDPLLLLVEVPFVGETLYPGSFLTTTGSNAVFWGLETLIAIKVYMTTTLTIW